MAKGQTLQDPFLNILRKEKVPVSIYLVNGIKLQGQVDSFDQFVVLLKNSVNQMVYKHAISTVVPARNVRLPLPAQPSILHVFPVIDFLSLRRMTAKGHPAPPGRGFSIGIRK